MDWGIYAHGGVCGGIESVSNECSPFFQTPRFIVKTIVSYHHFYLYEQDTLCKLVLYPNFYMSVTRLGTWTA